METKSKPKGGETLQKRAWRMKKEKKSGGIQKKRASSLPRRPAGGISNWPKKT